MSMLGGIEMDVKKNKVMPWVAFAASLLYAAAHIIMNVALENDLGRQLSLASVAATAVTGVIAIVLLLVTARVNRIYDPMTECADAVCIRYTFFAVLLGILPVTFQLLMYSLIPGSREFAGDHISLVSLVITALTIYVTGFPLLALSLRKVPKMKIEKRKLTFTFMLLCLTVMCGLCLVGILLGLPIDSLLTKPFENGESELDDLAQIMSSSTLLERVLIVGIVGPLFEELIFRKLLIDRTIRHGEIFSIILSGFMFGLFHGNFSQFFFAMLIGMMFAFIYIRSGSVIYSAILHMTMNLSTSIVSVTLYQKLLPYMDVLEDIEDLPQDILLYLYALTLWMLFLAALAVTGIVLYFVFRKKFTPYKKPDEPSAGKVIGNCVRSPMFWCFVMVCLGDFVSYYLPDIVKYFM